MQEKQRFMKVKLLTPDSPTTVPKIEVFDDSGQPLKPVEGMTLEELLKNPANIIKVEDCKIIYTHSSPGCVYFYQGGVLYKICT